MNIQGQLMYVTNQGAHIEAQVYEEEYEEIQYASRCFVDTSAADWTPNIIHYTTDGTGRTEWLGNITTDFPTVNVERSQYMVRANARSVGYAWDMQEIEMAMLTGVDLKAERVSQARRVAEEWVDDIFRNGETSMGWDGFVNTSLVTRMDAAQGAAGSRSWDSKTNEEILADINNAIIAPWNTTLGLRLPDTICLPRDRWNLLATRPMGDNADKTLMTWLRENNAYTQATRGTPLTIDMFNGLEDAAAGSENRMIVYQNRQDVLKFHMPMPLKWYPPQQHYFRWVVPGAMRVAGLEIKLPAMIRHIDLI